MIHRFSLKKIRDILKSLSTINKWCIKTSKNRK